VCSYGPVRIKSPSRFNACAELCPPRCYLLLLLLLPLQPPPLLLLLLLLVLLLLRRRRSPFAGPPFLPRFAPVYKRAPET
jgi:hypothetical protein